MSSRIFWTHETPSTALDLCRFRSGLVLFGQESDDYLYLTQIRRPVIIVAISVRQGCPNAVIRSLSGMSISDPRSCHYWSHGEPGWHTPNLEVLDQPSVSALGSTVSRSLCFLLRAMTTLSLPTQATSYGAHLASCRGWHRALRLRWAM